MRFNTLSHDEKIDLQKELLTFIDKIGGLGSFYTLLEDIRGAKQHPLLNKTAKFHFSNGIISWGKEIYKDKVEAIFDALRVVEDENILEIENQKLKKQILNSIRTFSNITISIEPNGKDSIKIEPFHNLGENNVKIDHIFQILFFDSITNTKKILKYK